MKTLTFLIAALFLTTGMFAQTPQLFSYQAVARDNSGKALANQSVSFRISILSGSLGGTTEYVETHLGKTTNAYGLVELEIGKGTSVTGTFSAINWGSNSYFVQIEMDPSGGNAFQLLGTSQLLSVPYALHAKTVENVDDADADPLNEIQSVSVSGYELTLNKGGGSVTLPTSGGTGIQGVQSTNNTLAITNPNGPIADIGLKLPFSGGSSTSAATFAVANQSNGAGLVGSSEQGDGITGSSASSTKSGIWGNNTGGGYGIAGSTSGSSTAGVWGSNSGSGFGLKGTSSTGGGVYGSTAGTGAGYGVVGESTATSGTGIGVYGRSGSPSGAGVYGWANNANGANYGVYGETGSTAGYGGYFVGRGYFSGNVGVGTNSPQARLHVDNQIRVGNDNNYPSVYGELKHEGSSNGFMINANAGGGGWGDMHLQTNGNTKLFIESQGNVGIGTTNPNAKLHVYDADGGNESVILPDKSISAQEMQNEPGIVAISEKEYKYLDTNDLVEAISTAYINAPSDGVVLVIASFKFWCLPSQGSVVVHLQISKSTEMGYTENPSRTISFEEMDASIVTLPMSFTEVFEITKGFHSFYFLGRKVGSGREISITDPQLTLIFLPTAYGMVTTFK